MSRSFIPVLALSLVVLFSAGTALASDECVFTKGMIKCVELHKQVRAMHAANQDYSALLDEIKTIQTTVIEICVKELTAGTEHHPGAFVKLCKKAAGLPTSGAKCDDSFVANGWDLLAFWDGLGLFKKQLNGLVLNAQTPELKALFEKYLADVKELREKAKARHHELFGNGGCDGSCDKK